MPEIRKFLDLSTAHVPQTVAAALDELFKHGPDPERADWRYWIVGCSNTYGWWIWAGQEDGLDELPADLRACVDLAKQHDCDWILFDRDTTPIDDLPTYDW